MSAKEACKAAESIGRINPLAWDDTASVAAVLDFLAAVCMNSDDEMQFTDSQRYGLGMILKTCQAALEVRA